MATVFLGHYHFPPHFKHASNSAISVFRIFYYYCFIVQYFGQFLIANGRIRVLSTYYSHPVNEKSMVSGFDLKLSGLLIVLNQ